MTLNKSFWMGVGSAYLAVATVTGFAMKAVIPALNPLGIIYTGLTWPIAVTCVAIDAECSAVPPKRYAKWLFTFDEEASHDAD